MKLLFTLVLLSLALPSAEPILQESSGLEVLSLEAKKGSVREDDWRISMISTKPPEIHPTLGRGDRDRTDPPNVATLKETRQDTAQRMRDLSLVSNKKDESRFRMVPVYVFKVQMKNTTLKPITGFVWAYHLPGSPSDTSTTPDQRPDQQYLCNVRIAAGETKMVTVASPVRRPRVIDVSTISTPPPLHEPTLKDMIINQIQFTDNDKWQRPDWNPVVLSRQGARKLGKGKCIAL
jgi:hypothetical protein